jgi:hypothetical protein
MGKKDDSSMLSMFTTVYIVNSERLNGITAQALE